MSKEQDASLSMAYTKAVPYAATEGKICRAEPTPRSAITVL
jgi:hypothetical protein